MNVLGQLAFILCNMSLIIYESYDMYIHTTYLEYKVGLIVGHVLGTFILYRDLISFINHMYEENLNKNDKLFLLESNRFPLTYLSDSLIVYTWIYSSVYLYDYIFNGFKLYILLHYFVIFNWLISNIMLITKKIYILKCIWSYTGYYVVYMFYKITNTLHINKYTNFNDKTHVDLKCNICNIKIAESYYKGHCFHNFHQQCYNKLMRYVNYKCPVCGEQLSKTIKTV